MQGYSSPEPFPDEDILDELVLYDKLAVDQDELENMAERHNNTRTAYVYDLLDRLAEDNNFSVERDFTGDVLDPEGQSYALFELSKFDEFETVLAKELFSYPEKDQKEESL